MKTYTYTLGTTNDDTAADIMKYKKQIPRVKSLNGLLKHMIYSYDLSRLELDIPDDALPSSYITLLPLDDNGNVMELDGQPTLIILETVT